MRGIHRDIQKAYVLLCGPTIVDDHPMVFTYAFPDSSSPPCVVHVVCEAPDQPTHLKIHVCADHLRSLISLTSKPKPLLEWLQFKTTPCGLHNKNEIGRSRLTICANCAMGVNLTARLPCEAAVRGLCSYCSSRIARHRKRCIRIVLFLRRVLVAEIVRYILRILVTQIGYEG